MALQFFVTFNNKQETQLQLLISGNELHSLFRGYVNDRQYKMHRFKIFTSHSTIA